MILFLLIQQSTNAEVHSSFIFFFFTEQWFWGVVNAISQTCDTQKHWVCVLFLFLFVSFSSFFPSVVLKYVKCIR